MRPSDFFLRPSAGVDRIFGTGRRANVELLGELRNRPLSDKGDLEVAVPLARLAHDELQRYEISELRRHFLAAHSPQDCPSVGLDCVAVTEALSAQVYDPTRHLGEGEDEPSVANTKVRIGRFIEDAAAGSDNAALRKLARAAIEFAQHVKHSKTPTRREAGIAADAVILLANILRRLTESE
jgi:hypothetical protein